ncbi:MAG: TonB-dependent receptor plug domain-containing protein [Bryobacteraceae bacterium]|nr:TonB-dependent receptor plug domain-containing protein [Bryobacteraceae bacterium]
MTTIGVAQAQVALTGRIADAQGGGIPGATVNSFSNGSQTPVPAVSDGHGVFRFPSLPAGKVLLHVEAMGFRGVSRSLQIDGPREENFRLELAGLASTVVVTDSGAPQNIDQATKAITVITAEEIAARDEFSLTEILRTTPGVQIRNSGGLGQLTQIRVRGLRPDATAILIDGFRFRDPSTTQGDATSFASNLNFINASRVEVLRGSGSSLYGSNAVGGAVNMVTDPGGAPLKGQLQAEGGGLGFLRGRATLAGGWLKNRLTYSGGFSHVNVLSGVDTNDRMRSTGGQAFLRYDLTSSLRLTGRFYGSDDFVQNNVGPTATGVPAANFPLAGIIRGIPLAPEQVLNLNERRPVTYGNATYLPGRDDPDNRRTSRFGTSAFRAEQVWRRVTLQASYQHVTTNRVFATGPAGGGSQPVATSITNPGGMSDVADARVTVRPLRQYQLTAGYEFEREQFIDRQNNGLPAPRTILTRGDIRQRSHAAFMQHQFTLLGDRLQILVSGRVQAFQLSRPVFQLTGTANNYDRLRLTAPPRALTGDISAGYLLPVTGTKVRAHYGNSYRAPALYERFGGGFSNNPVTGIVTFSPFGDPRLAPDRYNGVDFGFDQYLLRERLRFSATYFYTRIQQVSVFDSSGVIRPATDPFGRSSGYINGAGGISRGVELSAQARPWRSLTLNGSYTYTNAVNDRDIQVAGFWRALSVPRHTATLVLTQRIGKRADVTFDLYRASVHYVSFFAVNRARPFELPGYTKGDLVGGYQVWRRERQELRGYVKVENILNRAYYENGWRSAKAWAIAGLSYSFR